VCGDGGGGAVKFGLPFQQLLETLAVFASGAAAGGAGEAQLELSYPGPNGELVLE
jgi:hypothetical protein